jgi:hypothetical protein
MSSQLMAQGLLTATAGTGSGLFRINFFLQLYFELSTRLIVSM